VLKKGLNSENGWANCKLFSPNRVFGVVRIRSVEQFQFQLFASTLSIWAIMAADTSCSVIKIMPVSE
jgi:hypothetical protein